MELKEKLREAPSSSGIYIMKGAKEKAIYVGKAKNLKNRLRSYFQKSSSLDVRKSKMVKEVKDFDYVVNEKWPRLEVARRIAKDGSLYFGPYVPTGIMWETLKFIRRNFPLRTCKYDLERPMRP